jgi:predicted nucleic-acid-binding Zn-ribbon protein
MDIPAEKQAEILAKIDAMWTASRGCPVCGNTNWAVAPSMAQLVEFNPKRILLGGRVKPVVTVECSKCGYVVLMNAIALGLVDPAEEASKSADEKTEEAGQAGEVSNG